MELQHSALDANGLAPHKPYDDDEDKMVRLALLAWMTVLEEQSNSVLALSSWRSADDQFTANLIESAQRQTADEYGA